MTKSELINSLARLQDDDKILIPIEDDLYDIRVVVYDMDVPVAPAFAVIEPAYAISVLKAPG